MRPAQLLDPLDVEDREAFQRHVLHHDIVHHYRDRLRSGEVEIGVAEAPDIEARRGAAVGAFDEQARHARGERGDIGAAIEDGLDLSGGQRRGGDRHVLQVFGGAVGGNDDRGQLTAVGSLDGGVLRKGGGGGQRGGGCQRGGGSG